MNSLDSGFYTIGDAADLIALDVVGVTHAKLRRMFEETKLYKPAVKSDRAIGGRVRDISFLDLIERTKRVTARAGAQFNGQTIAVIAHAGVIRAAVALALDMPPHRGLSLCIDPLSVTSLTDHGDGGWAVDHVNRT